MDMTQFTHKVLMLRPMQSGAGGFVRLMTRRGRIAAEIHVKGLKRGAIRAWLISGEENTELGRTAVSRGEAALHAELPSRTLAVGNVQAIAVLKEDDSFGPLLLGLISGPETMTAARAACLALSRELREAAQGHGAGENDRRHEERNRAPATEKNADEKNGDRSGNAAETKVRNDDARNAPATETDEGKSAVGNIQANPAASNADRDRAVPPHAAPPHGNPCPIASYSPPMKPIAPQVGHFRHTAPTSRRRCTTCAPFTASYRRPGKNAFTLRRSGLWNNGAKAARQLPMEEIRQAMSIAGKLSRQWGGKKKRAAGKAELGEEILREASLPAIDPLPYVAAEERSAKAYDRFGGQAPYSRPQAAPSAGILPEAPASAEESALPRRQPVDMLPELLWPPQFHTVREMFLRCPTSGRFRLPGWRFVRASTQEEGLWIGRQAVEGQVVRIAYIHPGPPEANSEYQPLTGTDGKPYRALVQRI